MQKYIIILLLFILAVVGQKNIELENMLDWQIETDWSAKGNLHGYVEYHSDRWWECVRTGETIWSNPFGEFYVWCELESRVMFGQ